MAKYPFWTAKRKDLRNEIFRKTGHKKASATVVVLEDGIIAGVRRAKTKARIIELSAKSALCDGDVIHRGDVAMELRGEFKSIAFGEDILIGLIAKASGIATAANRAVQEADGRFAIVCNAKKKMPPSLGTMIRDAIIAGGAMEKISYKPFVYLDKNYVRIFGGIKEALRAVSHIRGRIRVIQIRGETKDIGEEAVIAAQGGANIIMIDTGDPGDIDKVNQHLTRTGLRGNVALAFSGDVKISDLHLLEQKNVEIVEVGRDIVDAPLLDMRLDVMHVE